MIVDKTLVASAALHVLVIGWGLISFTTRSLEAPPPESMPIDIISADQLSKLTAGIKTGDKNNPKPLVEKVAEAKPVDDNTGKITDKKEIVTSTSPEPPPKPVEKPVEKKPDPPKPKQERSFDQSKIAALLDKRDPTRQSITGAALNSSASLGAPRGNAVTLSQSELDAMRAKLASLWNVQPGIEHPEELFVTVRIRLGPDRRLAAPPQVVSTGSSPRYQAAADAAVRAVLQGQPYTMLRDETYEQWKYMDIDFDPKTMFRS